jgi:4-carboxymuconolactone decarboxylase
VTFDGRIRPVAPEQWTEQQREAMDDLIGPDGSAPNIITTFVRNPQLCRSWVAFSRTLLRQGLLSDRDREIVILRIAWRTSSVYEWRQHAWRLDDETVEHLSGSSSAEIWSAAERDLLHSVDEFCDSEFIGDANWTNLARHYGEPELLEVVFLCSIYRALSSILAILGVEPDTEAPPLPPRS